MMRKYRKKPVVIEAVKLQRGFAELAVNFVGRENIEHYNLGDIAEDTCHIVIKTLEGEMTAYDGDYIIKGIANEFYPCKASIFEQTYELVE